MLADGDAGDFLSFGDGSWAALSLQADNAGGPSAVAIRDAAYVGYCDECIARAIVEMVQALAITYGETSQGFAWSQVWADAKVAQKAYDADEAKLIAADEEAEAILHDWAFWARPHQLEPAGNWVNWLVMAGRGFGKTRIGAEQVRKWVKEFPMVNLVGPTTADIRDVMVQGGGAGSAIMEICGKDETPVYEKSKRRLVWRNGAQSLLFSAEEPERLRGPQHMKVWCDELAAWKYADQAWEQMEFGLRLGPNPQVVITTTPKPTKLIKALAASAQTYVTRGSTYDNKPNLAKNFFEKVIGKYEGTRLGRQELMAELLDDRPGALWTLKAIDADRVGRCPPLTRIVVGTDPAVTSSDDSAEWGILIVGMGLSPDGQPWPPHFYVLDDLSGKFSPNDAAQRVVQGYTTYCADRIVAEINNGGDLVEAVLRNVDHNFAYKAVHASRGKLTRAEPIAALYEQHRVHHVGAFGCARRPDVRLRSAARKISRPHGCLGVGFDRIEWR
jgi:phage terminase large subunit-like protein